MSTGHEQSLYDTHTKGQVTFVESLQKFLRHCYCACNFTNLKKIYETFGDKMLTLFDEEFSEVKLG